MNKKILLLAVLVCAAFSASGKAKYSKSAVYANSVNEHYNKMTYVLSGSEMLVKFSEFSEKGKEELFLLMHDVTDSYLDSSLARKVEVFNLQEEWSQKKLYKTMDFAEFVMTSGSQELLKEIADYGKSTGKDIAILFYDKSNFRN